MKSQPSLDTIASLVMRLTWSFVALGFCIMILVGMGICCWAYIRP